MHGTLERLRARREELLAAGKRATEQAAAENRRLSASEQEAYETVVAQIEDIDARISEVRAAGEQNRAAEATMVSLRGDPAPARNTWLPSRTEYRELESRAIGSSGNPYLPVAQSNEWYDRLRNASVVLQAGPRVLPMEDTSLRVPGLSASATVSSINENTQIVASDPTLTSATLTPRKVAALVLASNEALADSTPELRDVIAADLIRETATVLDTQFLTGNGTAPNMRGIRNFTGATVLSTLGANGGTPTLDTYATQLATAEAANVNSERLAWFMSPRSWQTIRGLKDSQLRYQLNPTPTGDAPKSVFGVPVYTTANIPNNLTTGTSTDTSWAALVDLDQVAVGRRQEVEVAYSVDFRFDFDQTAVRVVARFDIQPLNAAATVILPGIRP
jgi:HK97 family phage major capsid protein